MNDCPNCEYHMKRAQRWREEVYKLSGHPLPERGWVGLTDEEIEVLAKKHNGIFYDCDIAFARAAEAKLKEKNA